MPKTTNRTISVQARANPTDVATIHNYYQKDTTRHPPTTKSALFAQMAQDFCNLLVQNELVIREEDPAACIAMLEHAYQGKFTRDRRPSAALSDLTMISTGGPAAARITNAVAKAQKAMADKKQEKTP